MTFYYANRSNFYYTNTTHNNCLSISENEDRYGYVTNLLPQIAVANYISMSNLRVNKSHAIGKMVLCQFVDDLWYRACVERTHAGM